MAQVQGTIVQMHRRGHRYRVPTRGLCRRSTTHWSSRKATSTLAEKGLTLEVEQQLGDGIVRTIAMGSSDGLRRGMKVRNTGERHQGARRSRACSGA